LGAAAFAAGFASAFAGAFDAFTLPVDFADFAMDTLRIMRHADSFGI
jgi:hypothetical protein